MSPSYRSPQRDGGYAVSDYCDVDPVYGTLGDFDVMMAEANRLGLRVFVDLVPNHCSDQLPDFQAPYSVAAGSPERDRFISCGAGPEGNDPPNNWQSHFSG